jgi:hypothetical protein
MVESYFFGAVLDNPDLEAKILKAWTHANITMITSLDCAGVGLDKENYRKDDVPMFLSLSNMLSSENAEQRFIFTLVEGQEMLNKVIEVTKGALGTKLDDNKRDGIMFAFPLTTVVPF